MVGWDASLTMWSDPEPVYAALPAPEAERLSTQAEIDNFIEVAWETAPTIGPEPAPAPEAIETPDGEHNDR